MCMCVCGCVFVRVCVCLPVCVRVFLARECVTMRSRMRICLFECVRVCACLCVYVRVSTSRWREGKNTSGQTRHVFKTAGFSRNVFHVSIMNII